MLLASNYFDYAVALNNFYKRLTPWEKKFKYKSFKNFIYLHTINAEYSDIYFNPSMMSQKLLNEFKKYNIILYVVINDGIQYNLPHTLENIIIIPKYLINSKKLDSVISHELFHIYFRYFNSETLKSFRSIRSIVKIFRRPFIGEITNPDVSDYEGILIGNKLIFKVLFDGNDNYIEKYFTSLYLKGECISVRVSTSYEKDLYNQRLPFVQNYHSEEMIAEYCA